MMCFLTSLHSITLGADSEQPINLLGNWINVNVHKAWSGWKTWHCADCSHQRVDESCPNTSPHITDWYHKSTWPAFLIWVMGQGEVCLGYADREMAETEGLVAG